MKKKLLSVCIATLGLVAASNAQAILLSELFNGATITAGDKLFADWTRIHYLSSDPARGFDGDNIDVRALNDGGMDPGPGLYFDVSGGELSVSGDGVYAYVDLMFGFSVTVLDPGKRIKDNSLTLISGSVSSKGDNGFYINEVIGASEGSDDLGEKEVEFSWLDPSLGGPGLIDNRSDSAEFAPQSTIWVTKNILVWATDDDEIANLFGFSQRFSQTTVPEPASLALLGIGLFGLAASRSRKAE